jgi:DNA-directed RNA polymerase subunit L
MTTIKNIKKVDEKTCTFEVHQTTVGHANAIKRIFKTYIPVVGFDPNGITIHENTTGVRVEFIRHRIEMLPIDNTMFDAKNTPETVTFTLKMKNENKDYRMIPVLGKNFMASNKKTYFDPEFLILELKPGQSINLEGKLKLFEKRTIVNRNTALVFYTYDQDKMLDRGTYNFNFTIESFDAFPVDELIQLGKKMYTKTFTDFLTNIDNPDITRFDATTHTVTINTDDPHTFGNAIVQDILVNSKTKGIIFCGYKQPHSTKEECIIRIELEPPLTDPEKINEMLRKEIKDALGRLIKF